MKCDQAYFLPKTTNFSECYIISSEYYRSVGTRKQFMYILKCLQTIKSLQVLQRTETQWNLMVEKVLELEDTLKNQIARDRVFKRTFEKRHSWFKRYIYTSRIEWYWKCVLYCYTQKLLAIMAGVFSVCVVWSEVTFFNVHPPLSIFAVIVNAAKHNYDYFTIEVSNIYIEIECDKINSH